MSDVGLLAGLAVLFGVAGTRELLRGRTPRVPVPKLLFARLAGVGVGGVVGLAISPFAPGRTALLVLVTMPIAGFLAPDAALRRRARRRRQRLIAALPDALDLLAVGVGAGRGPTAGIEQLAATGEGPLAEELRLVVADLSCGVPLSTALDLLRRRIPGSELATLVTAIERSRQLGSPLADQLREQATSLRRGSRRAVEERAARAAPKIQLVVALVLVPSVLLMIAAGLIANAESLFGGF